MGRVEELVGVPICMISVGAERDAVIQLTPILEDSFGAEAMAEATR